jgi:hypothetical protein
VTAPTTTPPPAAPPAFPAGTYQVNVNIAPGRYEAPGGSGCYWERLSGFGGSLDEVIANDFGTSHVIVDLAASDVGFRFSRCGSFTPYRPPAGPTDSFGEGDYVVNQQVVAGTYASPGGSGCYWERLRGFGGSLVDIIDNDFGSSSPIVTIAPGDGGFFSHRCGTWSRIG